MSLDVILNTQDIAILGPPATVSIRTDIGAQGIRGSKVFTGVGLPSGNASVTGEQANDIYIRVDTNYIYQYLAGPTGAYQWSLITQLDPYVYSTRETLTFVDGEASLEIPVYFITDEFSITFSASQLVIQATAENINPIALSISNKELINSNADISLTFAAAEYSGTWSDFEGSIDLHITISIMAELTTPEPSAS